MASGPQWKNDEAASQRRPLDIEDYLNIIRRSKGWILGPTLASVVAGTVIAFLWADTYVSYASIRVVPPQVPEKFVPTNVNRHMADRVQAMREMIQSRNSLENIIQTHDLYRKERGRLPMEDIIEEMRKKIFIGNLTSLVGGSRGNMRDSAFQIRFKYENRYLAQKVTRDLMGRLIDENIREQSSQSMLTTQFLREQYEQAKAILDATQRKLTEFRIANAGRMPDQMNTNLQQVSAMEARIAALNSNVARANQEKMMLEAGLRGLKERQNLILRMPSAAPMASGGGAGRAAADPGDERLATLDREIRSVQRQIDILLQQYTPTYPDVRSRQQLLETLKKERDQYLNQKLAVPPATSVASTAPDPPSVDAAAASRMNLARLPALADVNSSIESATTAIRAKEMEANRYIAEIAAAEQRLRDVHGRIEAGPIGAGTLDGIMRDYELAKATYDELQKKVTQSEIASDLEQRKQGETLEVLDLPTLPETHSDPNRALIISVSAALGLGIGISLVVVRELKDQSLKTLKDVRVHTEFTVLGSIPLLENDLVVRRRRRIAWLAWSTACLLSVVVMSSSVYYYYSTKL